MTAQAGRTRLRKWTIRLGRAADRLKRNEDPEASPYGADVPVAQDVVVLHKYVFDVGRTVNPLEGAERLLRTDLATVAVHAPSGIIYNSANRAKLKGYVEETKRLVALADDVAEYNRTLLGTLWLLTRRPRLLFGVAKSLLGRSPEGGLDDEQSERNDDGIGVEDIERLVVKEAVLQAMHHDVDTRVLRPEYRRSDPWIRIEMQPCYLTRPDGERHDVDVGLVLHRTGTAVLTFYVSQDGSFTTDELTHRTLGFVPAYAATEMASVLVDYAASAEPGMRPREPSEHRFSSGIWWSRWDHRVPVSLSDVFENYLVAVQAALNADDPTSPRAGDARSFTPQWHGYSLLSVRRPHPDLRADGPLAAQLGAIVSRNPEWRDAKAEYLIEIARQDRSYSAKHGYWVDTMCAAIVHSPRKYEKLLESHGPDVPGNQWILDEQYLAAAIDLALVEYHTVVAINAEVESVALDWRQVGDLRARMLLARSDLDAESHLAYGDLQEIERHLRQIRGTEQYWTDVHEKLRLISDELDAETSNRRFRSDRSLQGVLGITAVLVGIASVASVVDRLSGVEGVDDDDYRGLGRVVRASADLAADAPGPLTVAAVAVLLALPTFVFAVGRASPRSRKRLLDRASGPAGRRLPYQYFDEHQVVADVTESGQRVIRIGPPHDPYADPQSQHHGEEEDGEGVG